MNVTDTLLAISGLLGGNNGGGDGGGGGECLPDGVTVFKSGTFTVESAGNYVIQHDLGVMPTVFVVRLVNNWTLNDTDAGALLGVSTFMNPAARATKWYLRKSGGGSGGSSGSTVSVTSGTPTNMTLSETTADFNLSSSTTGRFVPTFNGETAVYQWYAIA